MPTLTLTYRERPYIIPAYSLTGDLLAYRRCGLQYRYYNRGTLPPSRPVQQWFGEFIHAVMEEAFRAWAEAHEPFPWSRNRIEEIEDYVVRRLAAKGLRYRNRALLDISRDRGEEAVNSWGPALFPLITEAEVRLRGIRAMPLKEARADYYQVEGVVDVISSINLETMPGDSLLVKQLRSDSTVFTEFESSVGKPVPEIIVDYKGMRRPSTQEDLWRDQGWQVLTYAWLRQRQPGAGRVIAGVLMYVNELLPTQEELQELQREIGNSPPATDALPAESDRRLLERWRFGDGRLLLSRELRLKRSIRIVPVTTEDIDQALGEFDSTVARIETSVTREVQSMPLTAAWEANVDERSCAVCDFRAYCPATPRRFRGVPSVP